MKWMIGFFMLSLDEVVGQLAWLHNWLMMQKRVLGTVDH